MNSCCIPRHGNPNPCKENHVSTPKKKAHRRNLSAAFNLAEMGITEISVEVEQLNINTATEEELMTLPGINRSTARNIVDYRRQIGGFKKVEDIALVSGVGATKLLEIRDEICTKTKKSSQSSSRSSSRNDLQGQMDRQTSWKGHNRQDSEASFKANINTSNVFQLMRVKGLSQLLGENIVAYRDKKGPYKSLDDLVKVKGINPGLLSAIRPYLLLEDEVAPPPLYSQYSQVSMSSGEGLGLVQFSLNDSLPNSTASHSQTGTESSTPAHVLNTSLPNGDIKTAPNGINGLVNGTTEQDHDKILSLVTSSQDDLLAMYGPLLKRSFRHAKPPSLVKKRDTRNVIRIGSWNLQGFTKEKAENPGVKEVACLTILENG